MLPQVSYRRGQVWQAAANMHSNCLAVARAQDIAFVRANNSLGRRGSADEETMVSINDLIKEEGGEGEEDNMVEEPEKGIVKGQLQWTGLWVLECMGQT